MKGFLFAMFALVFLSGGCSADNGAVNEPFKVKKDEGLISIEPKKPTRITLRRNASGKYSWELKGEDPSEIMEIDGKIRKYIDENRKNNQKQGGR